MMTQEPEYKGEQLIMHWKDTAYPMLDIIDWHVQLMRQSGRFLAGKRNTLYYDVGLRGQLLHELAQFNIVVREGGVFDWHDIVCQPIYIAESSRAVRPELSFLCYVDMHGVAYGC